MSQWPGRCFPRPIDGRPGNQKDIACNVVPGPYSVFTLAVGYLCIIAWLREHLPGSIQRDVTGFASGTCCLKCFGVRRIGRLLLEARGTRTILPVMSCPALFDIRVSPGTFGNYRMVEDTYQSPLTRSVTTVAMGA